MPSLIRFFVVVLILGGIVSVAIVYLAVFVEPSSREMTIRIPSSKLEPRP